jgi:hypothetical protein
MASRGTRNSSIPGPPIASFLAHVDREELQWRAEALLSDERLSRPLLQPMILLTSLSPPEPEFAARETIRKRLEGTRRFSIVFFRASYIYAMLPADGSYLHATEIAPSSPITYATTLRYLNTLAELGLIERAIHTSHSVSHGRRPSRRSRTVRDGAQ